jgi:1-acyl-sn-glycerol-3-phosphate acyltransferase
MKTLISIYLWTIGILYMLPLCLITIALSFIFSQKSLDPWIKRGMKLLFKLLFIRVDSEGAEKIKSGKTYLFMSNHVSIFDGPLIEGYIPTFVRGLEARRQFRWPVYGWFIRRLGNIPIDRKNIHSSIRSIRKTEGLLKNGQSIAIMPEGHRTRDGQLGPFKKLPFLLAKEAQVDIVPIGISGLFHLKPKDSWLIRPTPIKIKFGEIIPADKIQSFDVVELKEFIRKKIQDLIERP